MGLRKAPKTHSLHGFVDPRFPDLFCKTMSFSSLSFLNVHSAHPHAKEDFRTIHICRSKDKSHCSSPNMFLSKTKYVQTCFHHENYPSRRYGIKHHSLTHPLYVIFYRRMRRTETASTTTSSSGVRSISTRRI